MLLFNLTRYALLVFIFTSVFVSCAPQMKLSDVGKLRKGMTIIESQRLTKISPKFTFAFDTIEGAIEVHSYILSSGDYGSNYFLAYKNNRLIYWGYPHEFARSKDPLLNEIGEKAVGKLEQMGRK